MPENNHLRHKILGRPDPDRRHPITFEFPDRDKVLANALPMAPRLAKLKARWRRAASGHYVNDNSGIGARTPKASLRAASNHSVRASLSFSSRARR